MFNIQQIEAAHSKVKTGADFPNYIKEIQELGVTGFEYFVSNGKEIFFGKDCRVESPDKYEAINISKDVNAHIFKNELLAHQQGKTTFEEFLKMSAETGISYWKVDLDLKTCTYFDLEDREVVKEMLG
ncbi:MULTISPECIES: DUF1398 domain-containing protein [Sphingobacterium]|uniref:DUF1398 domain-containing protein n=1 Tax=Sphingobacterium TaxID=28453 RepID=UPI000C0BCA77|nr:MULTISPECIES: DUF1398 family protein [Sphingobacterium]VTP99343.1 Phage envelope protein [Sphingobacterium daejeonense]